MTRVSLDVIEGPAAGHTLDVPPEGVLLGRSGTLAGDDTVSHEHADVTWTAGGDLAIRDLDSTNGTYVNGTRITGRTILRRGDRLILGNTVLTVVVEDAAPAPPDVDVSLEGGQRAEHGGVVAGVIYGGVKTVVDASGLSTLVQARGVARFLIIAGTVLAFAGFASWGYPIVRAITESASSFGDFSEQEECQDKFGDPSQQEQLRECLNDIGTDVGFDATPWLPLGAILFLAGAALMTAGTFAMRRAPD
ncbi:MAG TPA: FHA domain-containing protein [Gaiellaceae bacterium]|nr:FHA domain-containing protein [Gaiellaceae bacterium]